MFNKLVLKHKILILLVATFFILRLFNLTAIPIFNDEAIYINWGWQEIHSNNLFYSLYDAKPPLLMWIFGLSAQIFPDVLWAGRLVGVFFGFLTLIGIWKLAKFVSSEKIAGLASLFYIFIPLFSFFDRQALMESAIGAIGVWGCYLTLKILETKKIRWVFLLGAIFGIGYLMKTNALLFAVISLLYFGYSSLTHQKDRKFFLFMIPISLLTIWLIVFPMLIQPMFWKTLSTNSRYIDLTSQKWI